MGGYSKPILISVVLLLGWLYMLWAWLKRPQIVPKWRSAAANFAVLSVTISSALDLFLFLREIYLHAYSFRDPVEFFCLGVGALTALIGVVAGSLGRKNLRLPITLLSALNLLIWLSDANAW